MTEEEIKQEVEKVKEVIKVILWRYYNDDLFGDVQAIDALTLIPNLAIIDPKAKLPKNPFSKTIIFKDEDGLVNETINPTWEEFNKYQQSLIAQGWRKTI
jgi:hypothetical protein